MALVRPVVDDALKEITLPLRHEDMIRQQARDKDLDPALIAAVIYRESKFRDVTSHGRRQGADADPARHGQVHRHASGGTEFEVRDLGNPQINISYGSWYLRYLLDRYDGNTVAAVAAYNAGHENVDRWGGTAWSWPTSASPRPPSTPATCSTSATTTRRSTGASWGCSGAGRRFGFGV